MARILIVGGGCRGRQLAGELSAAGHLLRITTREERGRAAIEAAGGECWIGTPARLASLRGALEGVTLACWLFGSATGSKQELDALHGSRLELFLTLLIDTAVRGFIYEAAGPADVTAQLAAGERIVRARTAFNSIPAVVLHADPGQPAEWRAHALAAVQSLLG